MVGFEDLYGILKRVNEKQEKPISEETLKQILALVMRNPLPDDRGSAQEQIYDVLRKKLRLEVDDDN